MTWGCKKAPRIPANNVGECPFRVATESFSRTKWEAEVNEPKDSGG
jgi:hypothetical protein